MNVRQAELKDIPGIISVLENNLVVNKNSADLDNIGQRGFLIQGFTAEDANAFIQDTKNYIILVAEKNHTIIGYAIGCHTRKLTEDLHSQFTAIFPELMLTDKILYLKHIAKMPDTQKIGEPLLLALLERAKQLGYQHVACQIAEQPHQNNASIKFHEKFGFKRVGAGTFKHYTYGVYLRDI